MQLRQSLQALQRRLGQQCDRLYPTGLHDLLHLVDVEERRHRETPRQFLRVRDPVRQVCDQDLLDLDGQLLLELVGEWIQLRPRALDEQDGQLILRLRAGTREQPVGQILDRHPLCGREINNPLQNLLALDVLHVHRRLHNVDATATAALHVTLPLEVGEHPRHGVPVNP